jgi:uroporphyrinogen decarboxylase
MPQMTSHERISRMFRHTQADRVPIVDYPWGTTVARWRREGMPKDVNWRDYFDVDHVAVIHPDNSPQLPEQVIEETDQYEIVTTKWGATMKNWKASTSTPEFLDFKLKTPDIWRRDIKPRMVATADRIDWEQLKEYKTWREKGYWIEASFWFGFDVAHSWAVGTERLLMALIEEPQWCVEMFNHWLDVDIALFEMIWQKGYEFDCIRWPDDLGYKLSQFMSVGMYRELLKPVHKRAIEWAHAKGIKTAMHSCGDIRPFIPEFIDNGLDCLNALEVKAGVDPLAVKRDYGKDLVLHGGINAVLWADIPAMEDAISKTLPGLAANGGYIFATDHSIPDCVSFKDFGHIIELVKTLGAY